ADHAQMITDSRAVKNPAGEIGGRVDIVQAIWPWIRFDQVNCELRFYPSTPVWSRGDEAECLIGRPRRPNGIESLSRASLRFCRRSFRLPCSPERLVGRSYRPHHGLPSNLTGVRIHYAPIAWRAL